MEDLILKKVRFMEQGELESGEVSPDLPIEPKSLWKGKLVGTSSMVDNGIEEKEDFELMDGDI
ncbi:hypothetical protein Gorai_024559 [Gossypium raimondii]|uniref:Uncharacterized protein n=1 Tax=Gossypium raimondii TaxID=29730 RepID=A0A7J8NZG6_GOSRA|nr:hypothetical protein [Gossypium raimondii]